MIKSLRNQLSVMGVLNITPDSFSDGGLFNQLDHAFRHAETMLAEGVSVIDIGGESTRPGANDVAVGQELERVIPILEGIKQRFDVAVSIDTSKAEVMAAAIAVGADMINDVRALQEEGALVACATADIQVCLMHMQGQPRTMQQNPSYTDVVTDVADFFHQRLTACKAVGINTDRIWLDPGFGFGKGLRHNVELLQRLDELNSFGLPQLVGMSRKSMIGALLDDRPVAGRLQGSVAAAVIAVMHGAKMVRVHDVGATVDALKIVQAVNQGD